jgi:PAS domain S-box-containing protein
MNWALVSLVANCAISLGLLGWLLRESQHRRAVEGALRRTASDLEEEVKRRAAELARVQEQTADLNRANQALQAEIAERVQAEGRLREERNFSDALVDGLPGVYYLFDAQGQFLRWNRNFERITGYSAEEIAGMQPVDFFAGDDRRLIAERIGEVFARGHSTVEAQFVSKDGTQRPYFFTGQRVTLQQGSFLVGMGIDITERRDAEKALRESQQLLQAVIDNSTACVYVKDLEGRYLLINRRWEQLFHVTAEMVRGKTDYDVFPAAQAEAFRAFDQRVLGAGSALEAEELAPHDDGLHTYISIKCPLYDAQGRPYALCGISTDTTERKRAEVALAAAEEWFRLVVEGAPNAIVAVDRRGRIALVNSQVERLFGYGRNELLGQPVEMLVPERYRGDHARERDLFMQRPQARSGGRRGVLFGRRKDGGEVPLEIGLNPIRAGAETLVLASMIDLTARLEAEDRLKGSLKEKEALLQEVHHRVKNNLQLISSLLRLQAREIRDPALLEVFEESRARIQAMALVHERLYRAGGLDALDYEGFLKQLVGAIGRIYGRSHVTVKCEMRASTKGMGAHIAVPMGLMVNELVSNSLKHGFPGGRTGQIVVRFDGSPESGFELHVRDDGVGLPSSFSIDLTKSMGLRLVDMLVRQLHGQMEIQRSDGTGTGFTIRFGLDGRNGREARVRGDS